MNTDSDSTEFLSVRDARVTDMPVVQGIYAHHVLYGTATFEETPPEVEEMARRHAAVTALGLPYLVAEISGQIRGYCYANLYRDRSAFRHTLEDSIYVAHGWEGKGIGRALLQSLISRCSEGPWRQMLAVIGDSENVGSIALHGSMGFRHAGTVVSVGFKLGQWLDCVFMQRPLGRGDGCLPDDSAGAS